MRLVVESQVELHSIAINHWLKLEWHLDHLCLSCWFIMIVTLYSNQLTNHWLNRIYQQTESVFGYQRNNGIYILCNTEIKLEEYMSKVASTVVAFYCGYLLVKNREEFSFKEQASLKCSK